jgi:hypothetical protein
MNVMLFKALVEELNSCVGDEYKASFYCVFTSCSSLLPRVKRQGEEEPISDGTIALQLICHEVL